MLPNFCVQESGENNRNQIPRPRNFKLLNRFGLLVHDQKALKSPSFLVHDNFESEVPLCVILSSPKFEDSPLLLD